MYKFPTGSASGEPVLRLVTEAPLSSRLSGRDWSWVLYWPDKRPITGVHGVGGGVQRKGVLAATAALVLGTGGEGVVTRPMGMAGHRWALGTHEQAIGSGQPSPSLRQCERCLCCGPSCPVGPQRAGLQAGPTPGRGRLSACTWAPSPRGARRRAGPAGVERHPPSRRCRHAAAAGGCLRGHPTPHPHPATTQNKVSGSRASRVGRGHTCCAEVLGVDCTLTRESLATRASC